MKVRAVAAPSKDSTAVGSLELECAPHGLVMRYLSVGAYTQGYAPAAVTRGTRCLAAWPDVLEIRTSGDALMLSIDPKLTPHHKLYLKNFSRGDVDEEELGRRRRLLRFGVLGLMLTLGLSIAASFFLWSPASSQATALFVGISAAIVVLVVGFVAEKIWLPAPADSDVLREQLLAEIRHYRPLPVLPALQSPAKVPELQDLLQLLPRSTTAIVIVLSAGSLAAVLTSSWILNADDTPNARREATPPAAVAHTPPPPTLPTAAAPVPKPAATPQPSSAPGPNPKPTDPTTTRGDSCQCERPDSVLWRLPFPRLSTLIISQRLRAHKEHHHVELELAIVNNSDKPMQEISLMVQFFEDEGKTPTKDRPLYYESWLNPGEAIKWHVEARGSSFVVDNPYAELLEGEGFASADDFAELLNANHRPVRLHGAMMLAYLDDARAKEGATKLREALREEEAPYLDRVLWTRGDVVACQLRFGTKGRTHNVEMCVLNRSSDVGTDLGVKVRGLDRDFDFRNPTAEPPIVVAEKTLRLPGEWPPEEGRWVALEVTQNPSASQGIHTFEARVDAYDRLY